MRLDVEGYRQLTGGVAVGFERHAGGRLDPELLEAQVASAAVSDMSGQDRADGMSEKLDLISAGQDEQIEQAVVRPGVADDRQAQRVSRHVAHERHSATFPPGLSFVDDAEVGEAVGPEGSPDRLDVGQMGDVAPPRPDQAFDYFRVEAGACDDEKGSSVGGGNIQGGSPPRGEAGGDNVGAGPEAQRLGDEVLGTGGPNHERHGCPDEPLDDLTDGAIASPGDDIVGKTCCLAGEDRAVTRPVRRAYLDVHAHGPEAVEHHPHCGMLPICSGHRVDDRDEVHGRKYLNHNGLGLNWRCRNPRTRWRGAVFRHTCFVGSGTGLAMYGLAIRLIGSTEYERVEAGPSINLYRYPGNQTRMDTIATLIREGKIADAEANLSQRQGEVGTNGTWHYQRGMLLEAQGRPEEAIDEYEQAVRLDENQTEAAFRLAFLHDLHGDEERAIDLYEKLAARKPAHVNALMNLAVMYEDRDRFQEAYICLERVLADYPNHSRALMFIKDIESSLTMHYDESQERTREKRNAILDTPITDFELSVRSRNCLKKMNIHTLGDLLKISEVELLGYKNFGETSLNEIKAMLKQKGLRLGQLKEEESRTARPRPQYLRRASGPEGAPEILNKYLSEIELSSRSRKCLQRLNLVTVGDLVSRSEAELLATKNFGQTSLNEIKAKLAEHGLGLRKTD